MTNTPRNPKEFKLTGWHVFACFLAFFGVIIVVNLTMATFASGTWTGLVVKNSYIASQKFNSELDKVAEQNARGWYSKMRYEDGILQVTLLDSENVQLNADTITLKIGRPAFDHEDRIISIDRQNDGTFQTRLSLEPGKWQINVYAKPSGAQYRRNTRINVRENGSGKIQ